MKVHACRTLRAMHARLAFAASPSLTYTHACKHAGTHARKDCFGSRRLCRGNANSHARGDIHNTMPLITHCLCDGTVLLISFPSSPISSSPPQSFSSFLLFFTTYSCILVSRSLAKARHAFEQIVIRYATRRYLRREV